jgi:phage/plasmid-associated DNA primase
MASLVQWPGRHAFTAVVIRGGQGIGKGHFAHLMLGALFHQQQYLHIIGSGMLTGRFNEHLSGKVLVFADESTWGGDPSAADKLKGMVTESTIPIERKFLPLVEEPSALHIVIASNNEWPISIAMDDRRFFVLDAKDSERQNDAYFTPLREELKNGGLAAMLHDLLAHQVDEYALRHPPSTKGKREVMAQSLKPIERWWFEKLLNGSLSLLVTADDGDGHTTSEVIDGWPNKVDKAAMHNDYLLFLDKLRETRTRRSTETELGVFLKRFTPRVTQGRLPGSDSKRHYWWALPTLLECRTFWVKACGWPEDFDWDEEG